MASSIINQGVDPQFDALLIETCAIYQRNPATDSYGQSTGAGVLVLDNVPCRRSRKSGREFSADKQNSVTERILYMLPVSLDFRRTTTDTTTGNELNPLFYFVIGGEEWNILDVQNPSQANHHLEVWIEKIVPQDDGDE